MAPINKTVAELLLVDDDRITCMLQKKTLEKLDPGVPIRTFQNGEEAVEYIEEQQQKAEAFLILLDINMPVMNGWEFLDHVQEKAYGSKLYIAMLTSSVNTSDKREAMKYPQVIEYYEKLFTREKAEDFLKKEEVKAVLSRVVSNGS